MPPLKLYTLEEIAEFRRIRRLRAEGYTLEEIAELSRIRRPTDEALLAQPSRHNQPPVPEPYSESPCWECKELGPRNKMIFDRYCSSTCYWDAKERQQR